MFFPINGMRVLRFRKPSLRFIWFVQKPAAFFIFNVAAIGLFAWAVVTVIVSFVQFAHALQSGTTPLPSSDAAEGVFFQIFINGIYSVLIANLIRRRRRRITTGEMREFYVSEGDFSYGVILTIKLHVLHDELTWDLVAELLADRDLVDCDKKLRSLDVRLPEELRLRREKQRQALTWIQAFYVRNNIATREVLDELQSQYSLTDEMTNHFAHDLLDIIEVHEESLMSLINETQPKA